MSKQLERVDTRVNIKVLVRSSCRHHHHPQLSCHACRTLHTNKWLHNMHFMCNTLPERCGRWPRTKQSSWTRCRHLRPALRLPHSSGRLIFLQPSHSCGTWTRPAACWPTTSPRHRSLKSSSGRVMSSKRWDIFYSISFNIEIFFWEKGGK